MQGRKTLKDYMTPYQRKKLKNQPTWHSICTEETGVARPGKTARDRAEHCPDSPWVFVHSNPHWKGQRIHSVKKAFAAACKRAQLEDCTPHTLRHTCASWMVMAGRPLMEVRDILGHSTVKMTERYAHLAPENLRNAVKALEDRSHSGHSDD